MAEKTTNGTGQYVLLPPEGLRARGPAATPGVQGFLADVAQASRRAKSVTVAGRRLPVRVIDSIGDGGAVLVEATADAALAVRAMQPGIRVVPVVYYTPAVAPRKEVVPPKRVRGRTARGPAVTMRVVSKSDGSPVAGAIVVAFTSYAEGLGAQGTTNAKGEVKLTFGADDVTLERLYVYPVNAFWSLRQQRVPVTDGMEVKLAPIDLGYTDALRHYYPDAPDDAGGGVTVAVVDTGVADHPDLVVAGGANTVMHEDPNDYGDNGHGGHGTHVAGIVAARGTPPTGIRGVAPGVTLRSYRVFGQNSGRADSFAIAKAVDMAVAEGCDLVNMSLGGSMFDPVIKAAVDDARAGGSLCIVAAGNSGRKPVSFPASEEMVVAVSAMGRKGTFPSGAAAADDVAAPYGSDSAEFIGAFSNIGPPIDLTGPGVAIISTVPGSYAEISGTSMACPAVTGAAARALAGSDVLSMPRDAARSEAMVQRVVAAAKDRGFDPQFEGHGLPLPG